MVKDEKKQATAGSLQVSKDDTGSSAVQAAHLTQQIASLTDHVKVNKHDFMARRGLLQLVGRRRRLLQYIAKKDPKQYLEVVKQLGLRH